jgi:hypothetical protein
MSRYLAWAFGIGLAVLLAGVLLSVVAAGSGGEYLMLAGLLVLGVLPILSNAMSRRSRGWTRAWNPRAARRDLRAEQAATAGAEPVDGPSDGDEQPR